MATTTPDGGASGPRQPPERLAQPERLKREDPARTGPIRDAVASRRRRVPEREPRGGVDPSAGVDPGAGVDPSAGVDPGAGVDPSAGVDPGGTERRPGSFGDAVTHGVQLGYRVIEEQIRQGQRAAEQISRASYGPGAMGDDLRETTERMWRYYMDVARLWFDFVSAFTPGGAWARDGFGSGWARGFGPGGAWDRPQQGSAPPASYASGGPSAPPAGYASPGPPAPPGAHTQPPASPGSFAASGRGAAADAGLAMAIQVQSRRPVRVALDLRPGAQGRELFAPTLRASRDGAPGLGDVVFEAAPPGFPATVCVRVPDDQPPDTYLGVVVDRRTGEHVGSLSVSVAQ